SQLPDHQGEGRKMLDWMRRWAVAATVAVLSWHVTHAYALANQLTQRDVEVLESPLHKLGDLLPMITSDAKQAQAAGQDTDCLTQVHSNVQLIIALLSAVNGMSTMAALTKHSDDENIALLILSRSLVPTVDMVENNVAILSTAIDVCHRHVEAVVYGRKALVI